MDAIATLLRSALENGWRLGVLLFLGGEFVLLADHNDWPKTGVLKDFLEWATVTLLVGLAILIASGFYNSVDRLRRRSRRKQQEAEEQRARAVLEHLYTLDARERAFLMAALIGPPQRIQLPTEFGEGELAKSLISKHIFTVVGSTRGFAICELHPVMREFKTEILAALEGGRY